MSVQRRIAKELDDVAKDTAAGMRLELVSESDVTHLKGYFKGPPDTPYEGGTYQVDVKVPLEYPFKPPVIKFDTRVYHPNISSQTGVICLDILAESWAPIYTIKSCLLSLQSLLQSPNPDSPQDAQVSSIYVKDRDLFNKTAAEWNRKYAMDDETSDDPIARYNLDPDLVQKIQDLGFDRSKIAETMHKLGIKKGSDDPEEELMSKVIDQMV